MCRSEFVNGSCRHTHICRKWWQMSKIHKTTVMSVTAMSVNTVKLWLSVDWWILQICNVLHWWDTERVRSVWIISVLSECESHEKLFRSYFTPKIEKKNINVSFAFLAAHQIQCEKINIFFKLYTSRMCCTAFNLC